MRSGPKLEVYVRQRTPGPPKASQARKKERPTILSKVDITNPDELGSAEFGITCRELDERTNVISVEGDLDLSTAPRLKWMLLDALQEERDRIVLDLSLTNFMDSTALGVLVVVNRRLAADARMAIVCNRPAVLRIFELSGMDGAFVICPTFEEAYAHVHRAPTGAD
jgi:anti-sigma B factor antagonist